MGPLLHSPNQHNAGVPMPSERVQRRIDAMLDQIEVAVDEGNWERVHERAQDVLALDPENADARDFIAAAKRRIDSPAPVVSQERVSPDNASVANERQRCP